MTGISKPLRSLARLYGIQTSYVDAGGRRRQARSESLQRVLAALGVAVSSADDAERAEQNRRGQFAQRNCAPVTVAWNGVLRSFDLHGGIPSTTGSMQVTLNLEGGEVIDLTGHCHLTQSTSRTDWIDGRCPIYRVKYSQRLPLGYHTLRINAETSVASASIIAAPKLAYSRYTTSPTRDWGIVTPVYALRSDRNYGTGDLADLGAVWRWLEPRGGRVLGVLPLMAIHLQDPFDPSPYAPLGRRVWNELYVAIDNLPELAECTAAQQVIGSTNFQAELQELRGDSLIDYRRQCALRRRVLELLSAHCFAQQGSRWSALQKAVREEPMLEDYARFRAVWQKLGQPWPQWPERMRAGKIETGDFDQAVFEYHLYAQWATRVQVAELAEQLRAKAATLYLDYPVGVHRHGYDAWRHADLFVNDVSVGAPPDAVFTKGQDWGLAPLNPERLRATGYQYFVDSIRCQLQQAGALRIDHVMGLHRLFWIPAGLPAADGVFVNYHADELYAVLCLESHRNHARLTGENLGTVPPAVNRALKQHGISETYVVQYELKPKLPEPISPPERLSVASINTHDMPTFAAFWQGSDLDDLFKLGLFDEQAIAAERKRRASIGNSLAAYLEQSGLMVDADRPASVAAVRNALLMWLADSPTESLLIGLEDLWLELLPQNTPGTSIDWPNWCRKLRLSLESISTNSEIDQLLSQVQRARTGRGMESRIATAQAALTSSPNHSFEAQP